MHDLIGTTEAATILKCDKATVTRLAGNGTLTAVLKRPGRNGAWLFDRAAVEKVAADRANA